MKNYKRYIDIEKDYSKLKEPELSAMKFRDQLINIQTYRQDEKLNREKLLEKTHIVLDKYATKVDDLKIDLDYALNIINTLVYKPTSRETSLAKEYLEGILDKYLD